MVVSLAPVAVEWELHHGPTWQLLQLQNLGRMIKNAGDCQCCGGFPGSSSCVVVAVRQGDKHQPWSRTEAGCFVFCDALVMEVVFPVVPKTFMGRAKLWQTSYGMLWSCEAETQAANVWHLEPSEQLGRTGLVKPWSGEAFHFSHSGIANVDWRLWSGKHDKGNKQFSHIWPWRILYWGSRNERCRDAHIGMSQACISSK